MSSDEPESGRATGSAPAPTQPTDEDWMRLALAEAEVAAGHGDVPVGAVLVGPDGAELARAHNERQRQGDPTAHAELLALRRAAERLGHWRLDGCTLVVTLEPCAMCGGALTQARVSRLVFGADDPKAGAVTSLFDVVRDPRLPFAVEVRRGILADACAAVLKRFFRARRGRGI
jgi:tRNA(adenine34) deaminase